MAKCSLCGCSLESGMTFCPHCHAEIIEVSRSANDSSLKNAKKSSVFSSFPPTGVYENADYNQLNDANYAIILLSKGNCSTQICSDLLEDFLFYDAASSANILKVLPCKIAHTMTQEQVEALSQVYTEYGMQVQVINQKTEQPIDLPAHYSTSLFDVRGQLIPAVFPLLASISSINKPDTLEKYALPYAPRPFTLRFRRKEPVLHMRRSIHL